MNSDQLIPREIDRTKLKKKSLKILAECDRYIDCVNHQTIQPLSIKIYPEKYEFLAKDLKATGQDIRTACYRGYRLERYAE
jgi:hypothetical protein